MVAWVVVVFAAVDETDWNVVDYSYWLVWEPKAVPCGVEE